MEFVLMIAARHVAHKESAIIYHAMRELATVGKARRRTSQVECQIFNPVVMHYTMIQAVVWVEGAR